VGLDGARALDVREGLDGSLVGRDDLVGISTGGEMEVPGGVLSDISVQVLVDRAKNGIPDGGVGGGGDESCCDCDSEGSHFI